LLLWLFDYYDASFVRKSNSKIFKAGE
jgi:hypothetical protein